MTAPAERITLDGVEYVRADVADRHKRDRKNLMYFVREAIKHDDDLGDAGSVWFAYAARDVIERCEKA